MNQRILQLLRANLNALLVKRQTSQLHIHRGLRHHTA